jgi:hypothetical protein
MKLVSAILRQSLYTKNIDYFFSKSGRFLWVFCSAFAVRQASIFA